MGVERDLALGTIRFSLGRETSLADIERAVEVTPVVVAKVRKLAGVLGRTEQAALPYRRSAEVKQ
jgi:cysteine sulfinate desulfinase/cysteine desulfurase-like protein